MLATDSPLPTQTAPATLAVQRPVAGEPVASHPVAKRMAGRGSSHRPANPHLPVQREDDWEQVAGDREFLASQGVGGDGGRVATTHGEDRSQSIVNRNESRDLPFRWSVNPYRGCEHGCSYCYARPTHEFLGLDAGLGFESHVLAKPDAPALLRRWLARPAWRPEPIVFSGVTDCYQPRERELEITRGCLEVAVECRQPIGVITKNWLVCRDRDLLADLARDRAAVVAVSLTTLDAGLARRMEPRTSTPDARLRAIAELSDAGVPVHAMLSPVTPGLNDHEIPKLLAAARDAGATSASYTLLRLAGSTRDVFLRWLRENEPDKAPRIETLIRGTRNGRWNDPRFGQRMTGVGPYAGQIARTFRVYANRNGLRRAPDPLDTTGFRSPTPERQRTLF